MNDETKVNLDLLDIFNDTIRKIIRDEIRHYNSKQEKHYDGLVTLVNPDGTINVEISRNTLNNLPNRTGETLVVADGVRVYAAMNTMGDAYVGVKIT